MTQEVENKKDKSWGGKRDNSGRPLGSQNKATKEKKEAEEYFRARVIKGIEKIINSQMGLAQGVQMLFKIETRKGKGKTERSKPILITNQEEITRYLSGETEDDDSDDSYYFMTTKVPDNKALDSLLDRVFGRARQNIGIDGGEEGRPVSIVLLPQEKFNKPQGEKTDEE